MINKEAAISALKNKVSEENLIFSLSEKPSSIIIPSEWQDFGIKDDLAERAWYPVQWDVYGSYLPWTHMALQRGLIGTAILCAEQSSLIYVFHDNEDYYFYIGKAPVGSSDFYFEKQGPILPTELVGFYKDLHNGFTFHPSNAMGPLSLEDQPKLIDLYDGSHPPFANGSIGVFHNGAGDYLSVAPGLNSSQAFIWWHEDPDKPETGLDLWAIMDSWMSIFLEDTLVVRD